MVGEKELTKELLNSADLVMITTSHTNLDYDFVQANAKVIFDTKNACKNVKNHSNIVLI